MIKIRQIRKSDPVKAFHDFICELIDEGTFLILTKKPTMKEEKKWLHDRLEGKAKGNDIYLAAWDGKKLAGSCSAQKGRGREEDNTMLGIAILKKYRSKGLGEKLLRQTIRIAKKKFKPKNIWLSVFASNRIAQNLYKKIGFRPIARFPKWIKYKGKYIDCIYLLLKK